MRAPIQIHNNKIAILITALFFFTSFSATSGLHASLTLYESPNDLKGNPALSTKSTMFDLSLNVSSPGLSPFQRYKISGATSIRDSIGIGGGGDFRFDDIVKQGNGWLSGSTTFKKNVTLGISLNLHYFSYKHDTIFGENLSGNVFYLDETMAVSLLFGKTRVSAAVSGLYPLSFGSMKMLPQDAPPLSILFGASTQVKEKISIAIENGYEMFKNYQIKYRFRLGAELKPVPQLSVYPAIQLNNQFNNLDLICGTSFSPSSSLKIKYEYGFNTSLLSAIGAHTLSAIYTIPDKLSKDNKQSKLAKHTKKVDETATKQKSEVKLPPAISKIREVDSTLTELSVLRKGMGRVRFSESFLVTEVPKLLDGKLVVVPGRRTGKEPSTSFEIDFTSPATLYLFVHDRGQVSIPSEWTLVDGTFLTWQMGEDFERDLCYMRKVDPGKITIPGHSGKSGDFYGFPHLVVVE